MPDTVDPLVRLVAEQTAGGAKPNGGDRTEPYLTRGCAFVKRHARAPEYVIAGIVPLRSLYALTARPSHGKTAVATAMQVCIVSGTPFAGRAVRKGRVLVLCGENREDYALRLLATVQALGLSPVVLDDIGVIPGAFAIGGMTEDMRMQIAAFGEVVAVFVDTSAAYFGGEDEKDNVDMLAHALHLRALCHLPGGPAVVALCHPLKAAAKDNLLPRGGSAFFAEIDANLTLWMESRGVTTLHWQEKIRAAGFEPIAFELARQQLVLVDAQGQPARGDSVAAVHIGEARADEISGHELDDENQVLLAMLRHPDASVRDLANACNFASTNKTSRLLHVLAEAKLVRQRRDGSYALTKDGKTAAQELPP